MPVQFREFLKHLQNPDLFVRVPDVNVFDEHEDVYYEDEDGRPCGPDAEGAIRKVRRFTKDDLIRIARNCNKRDRKGSLSPLTFGHTNPREKDETKQPPPRGYALGYRVAYDSDLGCHVIRTNLHWRKEHYEDAKTYPRLSIELWPSDDGEEIIDPVSALRRTPARDIGQWTYARSLTPNFHSNLPSTPTGISTRYQSRAGRPVLRYSMDYQGGRNVADDLNDLDTPPPPMDDAGDDVPLDAPGGDPPAAVDAPGGDLPHGEALEQFARHCFSHPHAKRFSDHYAMQDMGGDDMGGDMGGEPDMGGDLPPDPTDMPSDDEPDAFGMSFASGTSGLPTTPTPQRGKKPVPVQHSKKGDVSRFRRGAQSQQKQLEEMAQALAISEGEKWVNQLHQVEGFHMNEDKEVLQFARIYRHYMAKSGREAANNACEARANEIREVYRPRIDAPVARIPVEPIQHSRRGAGGKQSDELQLHSTILQYQKDHGMCSWDEAEKAVTASRSNGSRNGHHNGTHN